MSEIKMINCPQCGNVVSDASKSCPNPYNGNICGLNVLSHTQTSQTIQIVVFVVIGAIGFGIYKLYSLF